MNKLDAIERLASEILVGLVTASPPTTNTVSEAFALADTFFREVARRRERAQASCTCHLPECSTAYDAADRIVQALEQARTLGETAESRRIRREDRLRAQGFEDPTDDERRERLARNMALKDWPR